MKKEFMPAPIFETKKSKGSLNQKNDSLTKPGVVRGFTLIELLVVIAIIGLLSSVVLASLNSARGKAKTAGARAALRELSTAIELLYHDTGLHPRSLGAPPAASCVQDPETTLDACNAGLVCTDGNYPGWNGPYINRVSLDPWGTLYYFDPDYQCNGQIGCEGIPTGTWVRAILSFGPNKAEEYTGSDDIVFPLCRS